MMPTLRPPVAPVCSLGPCDVGPGFCQRATLLTCAVRAIVLFLGSGIANVYFLCLLHTLDLLSLSSSFQMAMHLPLAQMTPPAGCLTSVRIRSS